VLVTFTWRREGQLFTLYEGKNLIGSGSTADGRPCDVQIGTDLELSREHAMIRCLGHDYEIFDQKSENGTFMNGQMVPVHGFPLKDRSYIRTGGTEWQFHKLEASPVSFQFGDENDASSPPDPPAWNNTAIMELDRDALMPDEFREGSTPHRKFLRGRT